MAVKTNHFLSYVRQGVTTLADHSAVLGKRMILPVKLTLEAFDIEANTNKTEIVEKQIALFGPGDLVGINEEVISRITPIRNANNFESSLVPFIEFSESDFLWRFSSRQTTDNRNWIPWITLIVLKSASGEDEGEFEKIQGTNKELPQQIRLKSNAILPDLKESWRWAHVHLLETEGTAEQITNSVKESSDKVISRLLSPRKLKPQTKYHAFLVPTFRIGSDAAMGIVGETEDRTELTWETTSETTNKVLPYYYDWEFSTGTQGDFENLVRKLKPRILEDMGLRSIDCSNPGYGMGEEGLEIKMEAALKSLDTVYQRWGMDTNYDDNEYALSIKIQRKLAEVLNKREEIIDKGNGEIETKLRVTPPVYGEWYADMMGESVKVDTENTSRWLDELNLDFRHRAAAGLGVQFVKKNQEQLMKAAWEQFSTIKKVNNELNLGRFGREISLSMHKRLDRMLPNNLFRITLPLQNKIISETEKTVGFVLQNSSVTNNMIQLKAKKYFSKKNINTAQPNFMPVNTEQLVSPEFAVQGMRNSSHNLSTGINLNTLTEPTGPWPEDVVDKTIGSLDPKTTLEPRILNRLGRFRRIEKKEEISQINAVSEDPLRPVQWYPEFHRPMYRFLREMSQEYILPGLEKIPQNTVGLLQTNRRFIEAFMVGLNHEMASELRWREFPTNMRGNYFRSFWDTSIYSVDENEKIQFRNTTIGLMLLEQMQSKFENSFDTYSKIEAAYSKANPNDQEREVASAYEIAIEKWLLTREEDKDIDNITNWGTETRLGDHPIAGRPNNEEENLSQIVLVIKGELLEKFTNTIIYLVDKQDGNPNLSQTATRIYPIFEGAMPPDIVFIGFPITLEEVGNYFLVFEEQLTELRFGLDQTPSGTEPGMGENDFSWQHFQLLSAEGYLDGIQPDIFNQEWNNAAYIAKVMMQKQVRAAIELELLLPSN